VGLKGEGSAGTARLGVFGGAFDPPHLGHVALAQLAVQQLRLDALRIFPTGHAWHKSRPLTAAAHRMAMARLAFGAIPHVVVDERETLRAGPTYTVDTLRELAAEHPGAELFVVMGEDQALAFTGWNGWRDILQLAIICVAEREELAQPDHRFVPPAGLESRFCQLQLPPVPVSATEIRSQIAHHAQAIPMVAEPVARYIAQHHLYQTA
jgi:nicotinate-nucleotide adenylyltransferase